MYLTTGTKQASSSFVAGLARFLSLTPKSSSSLAKHQLGKYLPPLSAGSQFSDALDSAGYISPSWGCWIHFFFPNSCTVPKVTSVDKLRGRHLVCVLSDPRESNFSWSCSSGITRAGSRSRHVGGRVRGRDNRGNLVNAENSAAHITHLHQGSLSLTESYPYILHHDHPFPHNQTPTRSPSRMLVWIQTIHLQEEIDPEIQVTSRRVNCGP
jgi:hypothetical protein